MNNFETALTERLRQGVQDRTQSEAVIATLARALVDKNDAAVMWVDANGNLAFAASTGLTDAGIALMRAAGPSAQRVLLGLDNAAVPQFANVALGFAVDIYSPSIDLDFLGPAYRSLLLAGDISFATVSRDYGRTITILITPDQTRNFTFPSWVFVGGTAPAEIAGGKVAMLRLTCFGSHEYDVIAEYAVQP